MPGRGFAAETVPPASFRLNGKGNPFRLQRFRGSSNNLPMEDKTHKPTGIKEIANALGISIGTVDRALHERSGISQQTRSQVLKMATKLEYRPNVAARNLKLNRSLRIAVHLPKEIACFFDPLREGISAAVKAALGVQVKLDFRTFPRLGEGDLETIEADIGKGYDGFILTVGNQSRFDTLLRKLADRNIVVMCVASDAPRSPRLASVSVDASVSGGIAAELLARTVPRQGTVVPITGDLNTQDHVEKLRGFAGTLATFAPQLRLLPSIESHESPEEAYQETLALLRHGPHPDGIYINTANSLPGGILATLNQRPFTQGKLAFEMLFRYLVEGIRPQTVTHLAPHIVLRSNVSSFTHLLPHHSY
jgi:LacI family transcriptional regulator